jgi:phosphopantothenoylcysteine decarboxylase/phosphopantothenate--cysteine ligase
MAAAVADWRAASEANAKIKKGKGAPPPLSLIENPDVLSTVGHHARRPALVVGFAAETNDLIANATAKLKKKGADWIVANDVSPQGGVMGGAENSVHILSGAGDVDDWPRLSKDEVARRLVERIAEALGGRNEPHASAAPGPASGERRGAAAAGGGNDASRRPRSGRGG